LTTDLQFQTKLSDFWEKNLSVLFFIHKTKVIATSICGFVTMLELNVHFLKRSTATEWAKFEHLSPTIRYAVLRLF